MSTSSPPIQPPPPKPTGAPGAPDQSVSSSHGLGSSTLKVAVDEAPLSSPIRSMSNGPDGAVWGTRIGPAAHRLPYSSACSVVGSVVGPIEAWMCSLGAKPRALNWMGTPGGPAHGLSSI